MALHTRAAPRSSHVTAAASRGISARRLAMLASACLGLAIGANLLGPVAAVAQVADTTFWIPNGPVHAVARSGNTIYIGGEFSFLSTVTGNGAALDIATGAATPAIARVTGATPVLGSVDAVAPDGAGGWYLGGLFSSVAGIPRSNIAHLLANGTVAPWNPSADNRVLALAVSGSTIFAGGVFTHIGGQPRAALAALNNTTGDATGWVADVDREVTALAVHGSNLYVGGGFFSIGGYPRTAIAALDVTTGIPTNWVPNAAGGYVLALATSGSTVYAGGYFTSIGGRDRGTLAAIDSTTGAANYWWPFSLSPLLGQYVGALAVSGNIVYAAGTFTTAGSAATAIVTRNRIAALDATTGYATAWDPNANGEVRALTTDGTTVFAAGDFTSIGGQTRVGIAALNANLNTSNATAWNPNPSGYVSPVSVHALALGGGRIYAGGNFWSIGGVVRNHLAALDATTGAPTNWDPNASGGGVEALAVSGSTVYAGGNFTGIGAQFRSRLAAIDATTGVPTTWDPNATGGVVYALSVSGTTVYAGGDFLNIGLQMRSHIAAISALTGSATAWDPSSSSTVRALVVSGTTVYAGGDFFNIGGQPRNYIAALDATVNTNNATAWNPIATGAVRALALSGTMVYAGGDFFSIGGASRNHIAALDATINTNNATLWDASANGNVHALSVSGSTLIAGGEFNVIGGSPHSHIAALNAAVNTNNALAWEPNATGTVRALALGGTTVCAGGDFAGLGGYPQSFFGVVTMPSTVDVTAAPLTSRFELASAPNPASLSAVVHFVLPAAGAVNLALFDPAGRRVATLIGHQTMSAGAHSVALEAARLGAGVYVARLEFGRQLATDKLMVVR